MIISPKTNSLYTPSSYSTAVNIPIIVVLSMIKIKFCEFFSAVSGGLQIWYAVAV
jgi:hypothetical protein